jgi:hypothetical protein
MMAAMDLAPADGLVRSEKASIEFSGDAHTDRVEYA